MLDIQIGVDKGLFHGMTAVCYTSWTWDRMEVTFFKTPVRDCLIKIDVRSDLNQHPPLPPAMC